MAYSLGPGAHDETTEIIENESLLWPGTIPLFLNQRLSPNQQNQHDCGYVEDPFIKVIRTKWSVSGACSTPKLNSAQTDFQEPKKKCSFYTCAALEAKEILGCEYNQNNYFHDFGHKYCLRFTDKTYPSLSSTGKKWMNQVLLCLQDSLKKGCAQDGRCRSCDSLRSWAYASHTPCYAGLDPLSGKKLSKRLSICEISFLDQLKILGTIEKKEYSKPEISQQFNQIVSLCAEIMWNNTKTKTGHALENASHLIGI